MAWRWRGDTAAEITSCIKTRWAFVFDRPSHEIRPNNTLDAIDLSQSCRIEVDGRGVVRLSGECISLAGCGSSLRLKSDSLGRRI
jgi:hypothetical protein